MNLTKLFSNLIDSLLLLFAFAWGVFGFICAYNTDNGLWFSRSGSVIVLICVIVEFRLGNLRQLGFENAQKAVQHEIVSSGMLPEHKKLFSWFAHLQIIIGTLIWGYGDLLF
jgi:hypothetical protein